MSGGKDPSLIELVRKYFQNGFSLCTNDETFIVVLGKGIPGRVAEGRYSANRTQTIPFAVSPLER